MRKNMQKILVAATVIGAVTAGPAAAFACPYGPGNCGAQAPYPYPGQPVPGQWPQQGQSYPYPGRAVPGQWPQQGQSYPYPGRAVPGQWPQQGQSYPYPGRAVPGQWPQQGQAYPYPGRAVPGQLPQQGQPYPYPGRAVPGQLQQRIPQSRIVRVRETVVVNVPVYKRVRRYDPSCGRFRSVRVQVATRLVRRPVWRQVTAFWHQPWGRYVHRSQTGQLIRVRH